MRIIYPSYKIVLRFSTIMAILFSTIAIISRYSPSGIALIFILSFFVIFILSYSFKIKIKGEYLQIFQYFICIDSININDIYAMDCISNTTGLHPSLLSITTKFGNKTYPIKLYDPEKINSMISSLNIGEKNKNHKIKKKQEKLRYINIIKFAFYIFVILTISKVISILIN